MPEYWYQALTATGSTEEGWLTAADEREIEQRLRAGGSFLVHAEPRARPRLERTHTDGKVNRAELLAFTEYMASSVQVGIPMLSALEDLEERLQTRRMQRIVHEVRHAMSEAGLALSEALERHPKAFSPLYIGAIAAGEASGHLDYVLKQLVEHLDWQQEISSQTRQATTYPIIVLFGVALVILILLAVVYPRLLPILTSRDVALPLPTRVLMATSLFLQSRWYVLLLGAAAAVLAFFGVRATESGRRILDRIALKVPVFGRLAREANMARLVTYLGLFYRSGVELILGLTLVERMMANRIVADAVRDAREAVVAGDTMSSAFSRSGLFPPMVVRAIALGETTGSLDETLRRVQNYYEREIPLLVRRLTTALQPMLVILLGGVILMVALSIVLPIMSIYESIGTR